MNPVSPTHVIPQIPEALDLAVQSGLRLPLVYNSGGYDSVETLKLLDGIVDIYMPDMKYDDEKTARQLSGIRNYPEANKAAVKEIHRQTGDLEIDKEGVAQRGVFIPHLVLPHRLAGTKTIIRFISEEISRNSYVNIMAQYRPSCKAVQIPGLERPISSSEFHEALSSAREAGLGRLNKIHSAELLSFCSL
jgi:putative pyruvate formate lyase activating enzyme